MGFGLGRHGLFTEQPLKKLLDGLGLAALGLAMPRPERIHTGLPLLPLQAILFKDRLEDFDNQINNDVHP